MSEKIEITRDFPVSAKMIYDAWLDPKSVKEWMCPGEGVTVPDPKIDANVGGKFQFDMHVGDMVLPHFGEYKELAPHKKIEFTWVSPNTNNQDSVVTIKINETGANSCQLELVHELLPSEESRKDHTGGWNAILECLNSVCLK